MGIVTQIKKLFGKTELSSSDNEASSARGDWYAERYEAAVIQRNMMFIIGLVSSAALIASMLVIRYIKNSKSIAPFVIEIEEKTGIPTVVEPVSIQAYSANDVVVRYFVMKYIKAREEYYPFLYNYNFNTVVRVLSADDVYRGDYRPKFSANNPQSPFSQLGPNGTRTISLKSIIFPVDKTAQIRFSVQTSGAGSGNVDKVALMSYDFINIMMSEDERLINPLGFRVLNYRVEDEKIG